MTQSLPVSRLINVGVVLTPAGAQAQNLSTLLILGSSGVIDPVERYRNYGSIAEVAADFGTIQPEYLAALLWFEQTPQPTTLKIGRWAASAAAGGLRGGPLNAAQQALSVWTAITAGSFVYTKNGGSPTTVSGLNFSGASNLNGVASLITAALTGAQMVWNATAARFELTSLLTGASSAISFLSAPGSGTDISGMLGMLSSSSGAYVFTGINAESAVSAVTTFDQDYGQSWYATTILGASDADHLAVAAYLEATNTKHLYGITTQSAGVLVAATTSDIAYQLAQLDYDKTLVQYSGSNPYAVVSALARILTTDYTGNNTVITLMYKQEPGITAENLSSSQADAAKAKNCNVFTTYNNNTAIFQNAVCCSGVFIDVVTSTDWLAVTIQNSLYNLLYTSPTKIPQTDQGVIMMVTTVESVCSQAVINGMLAPGVWNSGGFGALKMGDYLPKGFYVYAPKVSSQDPVARAARHSVPIQAAVKLAGAVHDINVSVVVNQ